MAFCISNWLRDPGTATYGGFGTSTIKLGSVTKRVAGETDARAFGVALAGALRGMRGLFL